MSVQSEINRITNAVSDAYTNVENMGGTIPASPNVANLASAINTIPQPTVNDGILTIQKNGTDIATFTANDADNVTANITVPTAVSELTNDSGFITGITSSDVTTALGFTPYNSTNPSGYITSSGSITGSSGSCTGNAATATTATKAAQDGSGNNIVNTYMPKATLKDYVVEQGVATVGSFSWRYRKWNSGQAEVQGAPSLTYSLSSTISGMYYNDVSMPAFPSWFSAANIQVQPFTQSLIYVNVSEYNSTTHQAKLRIMCPYALSGASGTFWTYARGGWS